jgi:Flp pilus assembly pilin Flp
MNPNLSIQKSFRRGESGATSVEYVVIISLIIAVCIVAISLLGGKVEGLFSTFTAFFTAATP